LYVTELEFEIAQFNSTQRGDALYWKTEFLVIIQLQGIRSMISNLNSMGNQTTKFWKVDSNFQLCVLQYLHPTGYIVIFSLTSSMSCVSHAPLTRPLVKRLCQSRLEGGE
jgi:hypothetical protein